MKTLQNVRESNKVLIFFSVMTTTEPVLEMASIKLLKFVCVFLCTPAFASALNTVSFPALPGTYSTNHLLTNTIYEGGNL